MVSEVSQAIIKAKGFFETPMGETLTPSNMVLIRELCHALELLGGELPEPCDGLSHVPDVYENVLSALVQGHLIAVTAETDTVIPNSVWEAKRSPRYPSAFLSNFWTGQIDWDHGFDRFNGLLPVVPRDDAEAWLNAKVLQERGQEGGLMAGKRKRAGRPKLSKAYALFASMGFDKGDWSWERTARHFEKETGEKPAAKTMRDWAAKASRGRRP